MTLIQAACLHAYTNLAGDSQCKPGVRLGVIIRIQHRSTKISITKNRVIRAQNSNEVVLGFSECRRNFWH